MVNAELCEVAARLFKSQDEDEELLKPVSKVSEIITFEISRHLPVWII